MCQRENRSRGWKKKRKAQTGFPAALKCVAFVGLHLPVRLIPSPLKMKMGDGAVNPHKNIHVYVCEYVYMYLYEDTGKLSVYRLVVWRCVWCCSVNLTCQDYLIPFTLRHRIWIYLDSFFYLFICLYVCFFFVCFFQSRPTPDRHPEPVHFNAR